MKASTAAVVAGVAVAAAALGVYFATWQTQSKLPFARGAGAKPMPELAFEDASGRPHTLADFRGKFVLLNIWATWCAPCREEMPALDRLQAQMASELQAMGIELDESEVQTTADAAVAALRGKRVLALVMHALTGDLDGLEINRINQLVVYPTLQTTRDPAVFAIGDCAACPRPGTSSPVPPRAQAAHQEASHMVRQIELRLRGKPPRPYTYRDFGSLDSPAGAFAGNRLKPLDGSGRDAAILRTHHYCVCQRMFARPFQACGQIQQALFIEPGRGFDSY